MSRASPWQGSIPLWQNVPSHEHCGEYPSRWAALVSVADKIGCSAHTLNERWKQAEVDSGKRAGVGSVGDSYDNAFARLRPQRRRAVSFPPRWMRNSRSCPHQGVRKRWGIRRRHKGQTSGLLCRAPPSGCASSPSAGWWQVEHHREPKENCSAVLVKPRHETDEDEDVE